MVDREKVIKALEFCTNQRIVDTCYGECPYAVADDEYKCLQMKLDALALLKEQEAVEPEKEHSGSGITWWNVCGNCKTAINPNDKYCHECGRAVKWNEID